jgi:hypothetical protein
VFQLLHKARSNLLLCASNKTIELKAVSPQLAVYFLAVYQIESFRVRRGSVSFILEYLSDERMYNSEYYPIMESLGEEVCFSSF